MRDETTAALSPAPLVVRTPAFLVDQLLVLLVVVVPTLLAGVPPSALVTPGRTRTVVFLVLMAVAFGYHFLAEWRTGRTLGKRLFGVRVLSDDGSPLGFWGAFVRNALRLVDGLGYWSVAVAIIVYRGDGKRLGDVVGRTLVVRDDWLRGCVSADGKPELDSRGRVLPVAGLFELGHLRPRALLDVAAVVVS